MTEHDQMMRDLANSRLVRTDFRILKAIAPLVASAEWCAWRDMLREIYNAPEGVTEIPAEPPFGKAEGEVKALRERVAELEDALKDAEKLPEPVIQEPERRRDDLLDFDAEATAELTGDQLLNAFEHDEAETAAVVQTLSATRLRHLSEQLNVERARLDREHQLTGIANPRAASIDRLIGLLTRRGEV